MGFDLANIPVKHNLMTPHQMERSLRTLGLMIEGYKWKEIEARGGYSWAVFANMMGKYPDLAKAWGEARKTSAQVFEDKALGLAEELVQANEFTGTQVRAHEVAMNQYRWSASRRDPGGFAEAGAKSVSAMIPVQIITSLNLGQAGGEGQAIAKSVWEVHADWNGPNAAEPAPPDSAEVVEGEILPEEPEAPVRAPLPENLEALRKELKMPAELESVVKRRPSPGRPRKGHKPANQTSATAAKYDKMKKSPAVRRALGIAEEDTTHGRIAEPTRRTKSAGAKPTE
jgi:hypothetical protein